VLPDLSDAGFQPDTDYRLTLPGRPKVATVRSVENDRVGRKTEVSFHTAGLIDDGLFRDNFLDAAPPTVLHVTPADGAVDVPASSEIVVTFNRRPLLPTSVNTGNITLVMVERRGRSVYRPIPGQLELRQSHDAVQVAFLPDYPLADEAVYELSVDRRVQDLLGNDVDPFESTFAIRDEAARDGELVLDFTAQEKASDSDLDRTTASWDEQVGGALAAIFTIAGGNGTAGDLNPTADLVIRPENFPRGMTTELVDGIVYDVYNFRSVHIPAGVTVRVAPSQSGENRPAKIVALKDIRIDGTLTVSGADGEDGDNTSFTSAMPGAAGGLAGPGGGDGASAYTGSDVTDVPAQDGGDVEKGGGGGLGGESGTWSFNGSFTYGYSWAGGGGGGGSRLAGQDGTDGGYRFNTDYNGKGGRGGASTVQRGHPENEAREPNVGGGGGGAITIQSAGNVTLGENGRILADGGVGGRSSVSSSYYGGAGGGGAGGSILIRATQTVEFEGPSVLSVAGGAGGAYRGTSSSYTGGQGGDGGDGYLRIEAREDENAPGKPLIAGLPQTQATYGPVPEGVYAPRGGGAPSVGQTLWRNLGVFDPVMRKPTAADIVATLLNDTMQIEVQMAVEDVNAFGDPDLSALDVTDQDADGDYEDTLNPSALSEWTKLSEIETLNGNGYQFIRIRVTFQLDDEQTADQPLPYLDYLRIPYRF
jgi:hypothetical protein